MILSPVRVSRHNVTSKRKKNAEIEILMKELQTSHIRIKRSQLMYKRVRPLTVVCQYSSIIDSHGNGGQRRIVTCGNVYI